MAHRGLETECAKVVALHRLDEAFGFQNRRLIKEPLLSSDLGGRNVTWDFLTKKLVKAVHHGLIIPHLMARKRWLLTLVWKQGLQAKDFLPNS